MNKPENVGQLNDQMCELVTWITEHGESPEWWPLTQDAQISFVRSVFMKARELKNSKPFAEREISRREHEQTREIRVVGVPRLSKFQLKRVRRALTDMYGVRGHAVRMTNPTLNDTLGHTLVIKFREDADLSQFRAYFHFTCGVIECLFQNETP